jgi:hypothetical protein
VELKVELRDAVGFCGDILDRNDVLCDRLQGRERRGMLVACPVDVTGFGHETGTNEYTIFTRDEKSADDTRCNECVCLYSQDGHDAYDVGLSRPSRLWGQVTPAITSSDNGRV